MRRKHNPKTVRNRWWRRYGWWNGFSLVRRYWERGKRIAVLREEKKLNEEWLMDYLGSDNDFPMDSGLMDRDKEGSGR